jgi:eukaryotic-like serine/threonine-protein kinase
MRSWDLADHRLRRGLALRDLGGSAEAAADFRRALNLSAGLLQQSGHHLFRTACCHAALAGQAGRTGTVVSADEGKMEADKAMECLRSAVAMGYRNANELQIDSAFDSLRNREDFKKLMKELEATAPKTPQMAQPPPEKK